MSKKYILFDLDGTITDSSEGITNCVKNALKQLGIEENNEAVLRKYIGPPLDESFKNFHGLNSEDALLAVKHYRERYNVSGIYENRLFDGIPKMLEDLKKAGYEVILATCKPEIYVPRILEYFDVAKYFDIAVGSELEGGKRRHKDDVINEIFRLIIEKYSLSENDIDKVKSETIMIGDRKDDILGAKACNISSMGVRYGFAEPMELENAGADYIVDEVCDIVGQLDNI